MFDNFDRKLLEETRQLILQGRYWARIHLKMSFSNEYLMSYISSIIRKINTVVVEF